MQELSWGTENRWGAGNLKWLAWAWKTCSVIDMGFISISIPRWNKYASGLGSVLYFPAIFLESRWDSCILFLVFLLWGSMFQWIPSPFRLEKFKPCCSLQSRPPPWVPWHLSLWAACLCLSPLVRLCIHGRSRLYPLIPSWHRHMPGHSVDVLWIQISSCDRPFSAVCQAAVEQSSYVS